ncbi:hypothetical protein, partial [Endozoicomonas atrinae]|uniref:hypothetical protein n=1 Tax=Endozoicomonas atrinae TaxID=1333660 RepID=UPI001112F610
MPERTWTSPEPHGLSQAQPSGQANEPHRESEMAIDAEKLDQETDAELAALMGLTTDAPAAFAEQEDEQDKQTD